MNHGRRMSCLSAPLQLAHWFSQTLCMLYFPTLMTGSSDMSSPTTTVGGEYFFQVAQKHMQSSSSAIQDWMDAHSLFQSTTLAHD